MSESRRFGRISGRRLARMLRAAGYERAALAMASRPRSRVGCQFEYPTDPIRDPCVSLGPVVFEIGNVCGTALLDHVGDRDAELLGCPILGPYQRDTSVDRIEQRAARTLRADDDLAQLAAVVFELGRQSQGRRQLDTAVG